MLFLLDVGEAMPVLCRDLNLLFVMVPGTGCSVVACVLCDEFGGERLPNKHASVDRMIADGTLSRSEIERLNVVATVRNPFDRFVTEYTRIAGTWYDDHFNNHSPRSQWIHDKGERYKKWKQRQQRRARKGGFDNWLIGMVRRYRLRQLIRRPAQVAKMMELLAYPMIGGVDRTIMYERLEDELKISPSRSGGRSIVHFAPQERHAGKSGGLSRLLLSEKSDVH
jgi:hypothetical protein